MSRFYTSSFVIFSNNKWLGNEGGKLTLVPGATTPLTIYPLNVIWTAIVDSKDDSFRQLVNVDSRGTIWYIIPNSLSLSNSINGNVQNLTLNPNQNAIFGKNSAGKMFTLDSSLVWHENVTPSIWPGFRLVDTPPISFPPYPYTLLTRPHLSNTFLLPVKTYVIKFGDKVLARQNTSLVLIPAPSSLTLNTCWTVLIGGNNAIVNIDSNGTLYYIQTGSLTLTTDSNTSYASLSPQGLNIVGYLSPSPTITMLSVDVYSQLTWHALKPTSPNCIEIVDPNPKCLPGLYQIQIGNTCLQSDLSFGICSSSPFSDTNKNVWFYDGEQLISWKEDAWNKNTVQLYIRNGRIGITPAVCDTSTNCTVDETITSVMRKGFVLTNSWLSNLQFAGLCSDLKTLTFKPFISAYSFSLTDFSAHSRTVINDMYKTSNPNTGSSTTSVGAVVCNRTPPTRSNIQYNSGNLADCCNGKYTKMGKRSVQSGYHMRDNIPDKNNYVISHPKSRDYSYDGKYLQVTGKTDFYKIMNWYFRDNGDVTLTLDKSVDYDADSDTIQLYEDALMIDGDYCDKDWCPWSNTCRTIAPSPPTTDYCSQLDVNGSPLLNTDVNCVNWCGSQPTPYAGSCGDASSQFCKIYPKHPACTCQNFFKTDAWKSMSSLFNAIPNCPDCSYVPRPECWATPCTSGANDPNRALKTSEQLATSCPPTTVNICSQILNVQRAGGNVTIDNNVFQQICGQPLPSPSPSPNPSPNPNPTPNPNPNPTPQPVMCVYGDWGEYGPCKNNLQSRVRALKSGPSTCQSVEIQSQTCIAPDNSSTTGSTDSKKMIYIGVGVGGFILLLLIILYSLKSNTSSPKN
jgi:hypothetical protein